MKITKTITIHAGERKEIHGLTKIKPGGDSVHCIIQPAMDKALPKGLKLITDYSSLGAGSSIPAKTIVGQVSLANMIPKLIYPGDDYDNEIENLDSFMRKMKV